MLATSRPFILFFVGVLLSSIAFSPFILDYTLTPRSIAVSAFLVIMFLFLIRTIVKIPLNFTFITYALYVIFSFLSMYWCNTRSEAIFENSKLMASFLIFVVSFHLFYSDKTFIMNALCKISIILFLIELSLALFQLMKLHTFQKENLYSIYGMNSHKNLFSSFILLQLPFVILALKKLSGIWKPMAFAALICYFALIALLQTKAVWIGCAVSVLFFLVLYLYKRSTFYLNTKLCIAIAILSANLFFVFALPQLIKKGLHYNVSQNEIIEKKQELDHERLLLWDKTYIIFREHSLAGVGSGNWQINFPSAGLTGLWRAEDLNYTFQRPHNDLLWILSETGLIGFNLFALFIFSLFFNFINAIKRVGKEEFFELAIFASVIPGFFSAAFFDFPKERMEHMFWLNIIFGFCFYFSKKNTSSTSIKDHTLGSFAKFSAVVISVCIFVCGIYRYLGEYHTRKMYDHKAQNQPFGVIKEGEAALSFVYQVDPTSLPIQWYTGNAYALQNNFDRSRVDLTEALNKNPFNRNVLNDLGSSYAAMGLDDEAINFYRKSLRISPRFDDPCLNMTVIYIKQKKYKMADSCLKSLFHDSERRTHYQKMVDAFMPDQYH